MRRRPYPRALSPSTLAFFIALGCAGCVPRFAYVVDSDDDSVSVYAVDNAAGRLRSLGYRPTGANPRGIAFRMDGRFAYVVNAGGAGVGSVSAYAVDAATGTLTPLDADGASPGIQNFPAGPSSRGLAIRGDFLYVANFGIVPGGTGSVSTFAIDSTSGMLTPMAGLPIAAGINPMGIVSNGTFVYVLNSGNPDAGLIGRRPGISAYTVAGTGTLTRIDANPASPAVDDFETSRMPEAIALRHDGKGIVLANGDLGTISVYDIDAASGALSRVDADATTAGIQDFAIGSNPRALASANGFVYAANRAALLTGTLATFRASPSALAHVDTNPATAAVDDLPVGTTPAAVGIATSTRICGWFGVCYRNDFVYVANSGSHDIDTVSTDDFATGAMSAKLEAPTLVGRRGPVAIATVSGRSAVSIAARRAFVSHAGAAAEGVVWSYDVDPSTGALTPITTAHQGPYGVFAGRPNSIVATADGKFVFAGRSTDGRLDGYSVNPATGVLGVAGSVTANPRNVPNQRTQVLIDPSQRFLYYADDVAETWGFSIDATSGALTALPGSPYYMRPSLAMHPSGRFLYGFVGSFWAIHRSTGVPTYMGQIARTGGLELEGAAVDPSGRFLYFAGNVESPTEPRMGVAAYRIDASTGTASEIDRNPATAEIELYETPSLPKGGIVADPQGRFLFVGEYSRSAIWVFRIDSASGALSPVDAQPSTTTFDAFATESFRSFNVEPTGRFLYVPATNGGIFAYQIDSVSGILSPIDTDPGTPGKQGYPSSFSPTAIAFWSEIK